MPVAGKTPVGESPEKMNRKKGRNENMKRRFWAGLLSFVMLWSLLPASALATEEDTPEPVTSVTEENAPVYIHMSGRTATPATGSIWPCMRLPTPMITSTKPVITRLGAA